MAADAVVSRELKSLQNELLVTQQERAAASASPSAVPSEAALLPNRPAEPAEDSELRGYLRELANEMTSFFDDAEKTISAHPAQSVAGALLLGILIGQLMSRR
jgi:ElaB/YqjD/DUF883 family membrane-anchored ribosome-binding protein